ncbi:MAG: tRNA(Glu)-specific nuclease WapA precursor [Firmicutes bacterium ADurb.Bin182]|nr:MAG: tRNA(Glu)-specific nuclease WapA precursor [Firmicutes bacterium ADurb.Bin182]
MARYLYEYQRVVLEQDAFGDQKAWNVYGINLISRQVDELTLTYMYNGHADVTALLDSNGNLVATYYYDAFGNILEKTGTVDNNILYGGYQYDEETGLYYLNARMYDPITARFLQEDTYKGQYNDPLSLNLYTYCHNEPLMYSDPTGHARFSLKDIINAFLEKAKSLLRKADDFIKETAKSLSQAVSEYEAMLIKAENALTIVAVATVFVAALVVSIPAVAFIGGMVTTGLGLGSVIGSAIGAAGVVAVAGMAIAIAESNIEEIYTGTNPIRDNLLGGNQELYDGVQGTVAALGFWAISIAATYPAPRNSQEQTNTGSGEGGSDSTIVYRALNQKDYDRLGQGLGLEAKNPNGNWALDEHLVNGSSKNSWANDPFISTTSDINVAKGFNQAGSNLGIVEIDMSKVSSSSYKGFEIYPRVN